MNSITVPISLWAGFISFFSPCLLPFKLVSGIIIILFGLYMLNIIKLNFITLKHIKMPRSKGFLGSVLIGMAFSLGWTPCVGSVLGSILFLAATQNTVSQGVIMLSAYSLGLAIPFIIVSLVLDRFNKHLHKIEKFSVVISKIGGLLILIMGILVTLDKLNWLLQI